MSNLTLFKWLSFLLSLLYLTGNVALALVFCGTSHQDTSSSPGTIQLRGPNANCNNNSTVFQGFFRKKENYIPYSGNPHPARVLYPAGRDYPEAQSYPGHTLQPL